MYLEDPKLPIDESTEKNRILLKDENIPHISFYEMLEFEETLDEKLKGEIEEKLKRTNLLGAQIISKDDFNKVTQVNHETSDYYLITHKEIKDITSFIITQDFINQNDWNILFNHFGIEDTKLNNINSLTCARWIDGEIFAKIRAIFSICLENYNNLTFYVSNNLNIERSFKNKTNELVKQTIKVEDNNDIVIKGLGFIKVTNSDVIDVYTLEGVEIYTRNSLI